MNKKEAIRQLNIGYILFISGFLIGLSLHLNNGQSNFMNGFILAYLMWSTYWGYKIIYSQITSFFKAPIHIEADNTLDYIIKTIIFKYTIEFIKFWICYLVGALGGGIYKQIKLSKIAYL